MSNKSALCTMIDQYLDASIALMPIDCHLPVDGV
jgi:hypothetical protein